MTRKFAAAGLLAILLTGSAMADDGNDPNGIPRLDHVWLIMMENHGFNQIIGNPDAPFINSEAAAANLATNYFAVAHPNLTNYLEVVGGSNFGILNDNSPDWHNAACSSNLATGVPSTESSSSAICPISGNGKDAATPAIDFTNETSGPPGVNNIDGIKSYPAAATKGLSIADQLVVTKHKTWKTYQENLPFGGADRVNNSDGVFSNLTTFTAEQIAGTTAAASAAGDSYTCCGIVALYAVKHNPFAYFRSVQEGAASHSLANIVGFDGVDGLYADLREGRSPSFSFIAPNQCNDQHGKSGQGPFCDFDSKNNGTLVGLNPTLIARGDVAVQKLVTAIKTSQDWEKGNNAIVIVWDEDDYSVSPTVNKVATIVDTNYGAHGLQSTHFYTHFSLLKTLEAGFGLPCLNHACDPATKVIADLFN